VFDRQIAHGNDNEGNGQQGLQSSAKQRYDKGKNRAGKVVEKRQKRGEKKTRMDELILMMRSDGLKIACSARRSLGCTAPRPLSLPPVGGTRNGWLVDGGDVPEAREGPGQRGGALPARQDGGVVSVASCKN